MIRSSAPWWKRPGDLLLAAILAVLLAPVAVLTMCAVWACLGRPILYRQHRPGLGGEPFVMLKFRTMREAEDARGAALPDAVRLTRFGRWLRATSLDELPELWNVMMGDMSLVGPRPLLPEYLPLYSPRQARRHEVRPGITGWAQVNGRNALSWEERFALDVWYVDHLSFWLDMRILWRTVWTVVARRGVTQDGHATAERFRGHAG